MMDIVLVAPHSPQAVGYEDQDEFIEYAEYHHHYCRELSRKGHNVEFWHLGPENSTTEHDFGHKIRQFKTVSLPIIDLELSPELYSALLDSHIDIVHFHSLHSMENWIPYFILNFIDVGVAAQNHGPELNSSKLSARILYTILDILIPGRTGVLSVNKNELDNLQKYISAQQFEYIPNGIDTSKYSPKDKISSRKILGLDEDSNYVLYVGRITQSKGVNYLIDAMEGLSANLLLVYGGGDEDLLSKYKSSSPSNVKFIGPVDDESLLRYYDAADVCVFPSINEGFGVVCLEAMASQTATIGTDAHQEGRQQHLIDGENSLVVSRRSSSELRDAIVHLLSDQDFRQKLAIQGRDHVEQNFSWKQVGNKMEEIYKNILEDEYNPYS
jgi:glycosyltransferase involved in cell wall biosynthesis